MGTSSIEETTVVEFNTAVLNDQDLLYGGVVDLVDENKLNARRWARMVELHRRCPDTEGNFAMAAREWAAAAIGDVWAYSDRHTRHELNVALFLTEHLPEIWELCLSGALDHYRATTAADIIRNRLDDPADWAAAGAKVARYLRRHLRDYPSLGVSMVTCTVVQLRNKVNYETRVRRAADEEFARQYADRSVQVLEGDDGIGQLLASNSIDKVRLARHRLHLSAKALRAAGDQRTIEQLMSDLMFDLVMGTADGVPIPQYARPIINVTVPLTTLAGLDDHPAQLSGGTLIPADLARAIATSEGATWYRLLTDADDEPLRLSTKSYQPTGTIWRYVVATQPTCVEDNCDRPSVECELDHDLEWPEGATSTENLKPRCRRHHKLKHALAERPDLDWEYGPSFGQEIYAA